MDKLLTIAIPSYNMEEYLPRCIDSLIIDNELMPLLDIIVVNDGSKDGTSHIAHNYADRFPNSIRVIDKDNGHYGSCINASLKIAIGKYFRILDADDWFDTDGLRKLLLLMEDVDVDCIRTNYKRIYSEGREGVYFSPEKERGRFINLEAEEIETNTETIRMHQLAFKLDLLKRFGYTQTEGICYTDMEYALYPLCHCKTMYDTNIFLYQYFLGRDEQTMNVRQLVKNSMHYAKILERMLDFSRGISRANETQKKIIRFYLAITSECLVKWTLSLHTPNKDDENEVRRLISLLETTSPQVFSYISKYKTFGLPIYGMWYKIPSISKLIFPFIRFAKRRFYKI